MEEVSIGLYPFDLTVGGLQGVPNLKSPKLLWLGFNNATRCTGGIGLEKLKELKQRLDRELDKRGIRVEKRDFKPHLTLCRIRDKKERHAAGRRLAGMTRDKSNEIIKKEIDFTVDSFVLFSSRLNPGGALHRPIVVVQLKGPAP